jgi:hypothetical protein
MNNLAPALVVIALTLGLIFLLRDKSADLPVMSLEKANQIVKDIQGDSLIGSSDTVYVDRVVYKTKFVSYQGWDFKAWTGLDSTGLLRPDTVFLDTLVLFDTIAVLQHDSILIPMINSDTLSWYKVYQGSDTTEHYTLEWEARVKSDLSEFFMFPIVTPVKSKWYDHPTDEELARETLWCRILKALRIKKECNRK